MPDAQPDDFKLAVQQRFIRWSCCCKDWKYAIPHWVKPTNQVILTVAKEHQSGTPRSFSMYFPATGGTKRTESSSITIGSVPRSLWEAVDIFAESWDHWLPDWPSDYSTWFGSTQKKTTSFIWDWIRYCMTTLNAPNHQKEICCKQTWCGMNGPFSWSLKWWYQIYQFETRGLWLSFAAQQDERMRWWANRVSVLFFR